WAVEGVLCEGHINERVLALHGLIQEEAAIQRVGAMGLHGTPQSQQDLQILEVKARLELLDVSEVNQKLRRRVVGIQRRQGAVQVRYGPTGPSIQPNEPMHAAQVVSVQCPPVGVLEPHRVGVAQSLRIIDDQPLISDDAAGLPGTDVRSCNQLAEL